MATVLPEGVVRPLAQIVGIALLAGTVSVVLAGLYRWYARLRLPAGLSLFAGFGVVAIYLNTTAALGQAIVETDGLLELDAVVVNVAAFGAAGATALGASRIGDRLGRVASAASGAREFDAEVSRVVTAVGRAIAVELPENIEDIEGYDPESEMTKAELAGKTLLFPRRLTVAELRDRLVTRLKEDYGVGHVGLEIDDDGTVSYLAVGRRAAGLGPTLAPGDVAAAIRADPPFAASSGDVVDVWTRDSEPDRLTTAEVRAKADDVVTLALDGTDAERLDSDRQYRLVTRSAASRADREFAGLLRAADETFGVVTVRADSPLVGTPVGGIVPTVVAVGSADGPVDTLPSRTRILAAGDTLYLVARPEALRRIEAAAAGEASPADAPGAESS